MKIITICGSMRFTEEMFNYYNETNILSDLAFIACYDTYKALSELIIFLISTNALMILTLISIAISLFKTALNIETPCSVKA